MVNSKKQAQKPAVGKKALSLPTVWVRVAAAVAVFLVCHYVALNAFFGILWAGFYGDDVDSNLILLRASMLSALLALAVAVAYSRMVRGRAVSVGVAIVGFIGGLPSNCLFLTFYLLDW